MISNGPRTQKRKIFCETDNRKTGRLVLDIITPPPVIAPYITYMRAKQLVGPEGMAREEGEDYDLDWKDLLQDFHVVDQDDLGKETSRDEEESWDVFKRKEEDNEDDDNKYLKQDNYGVEDEACAIRARYVAK